MNRQESDILKALMSGSFSTQRALAAATGHSLGAVNNSLKALVSRGFIDCEMRPTQEALSFCEQRAPRNAIILAAGMGMRMAPINIVNPKALLEVHGESLIERQIHQLNEVGIRDITIVVGFMKEKFDFLIDEYGVDLVVNTAYVHKNNLASLALVADRIANTYIVPCDVWCAENPFSARELSSWYLVTDGIDVSEVRVNRKGELVYVAESAYGNTMVGISYVLEEDADALRSRLKELASDSRHDNDFWEEALRRGDRMLLPAKVVADAGIVEIDTYEQLRDLDGSVDRLGEDDIANLAERLGINSCEITDVTILKKGLMNSTFSFSARGKRYALRVPSDRMDCVDKWRRERDALAAIAGLGLCDAPVCLDVETGYKLTRFVEGIRPCDPENEDDLACAMATLRKLHEAHCVVQQVFDPFADVEAYELLRGGEASMFRDYAQTKARVMELRPFVERHAAGPCLIHADPDVENFLIAPDVKAHDCVSPGNGVLDGGGERSVQLIDWEYAAMGDPHADVALFCIFAFFDQKQTDRLINMYFAAEGGCTDVVRAKIYCYMAICGLLWSNWCEYEWHRGVEFGEYSLRQYRYAKDFARLAKKLIYEGLRTW